MTLREEGVECSFFFIIQSLLYLGKLKKFIGRGFTFFFITAEEGLH